MLKLILTTILSLVVATAAVFAQTSPIDKGAMQLGGGISFHSYSGDLYENQDEDGVTEIILAPEFGYFVIPGLTIGGELVFGSASQGDQSSSVLGIGPAVAYYFDMDQTRTEVKGKVYPYLGLAFLYNTISYSSGDPGDEDDKWRQTTFSLRGGAAFMVSGAVGIYGQVGFDFDSSKRTEPFETDSESGSVFGLEIGVTSFIY
jgi:hypothetical protein